jgi:hypothetical protein
MEANANPMARPGERNVLCHHYEGCLDYAVARRWLFWDCSRCPHRNKKRNLGGGVMVKDFEPEYHVATESFRDLVAS